MISLTTCQAMQYALLPGASPKFESLSKCYLYDETTSELEASRILFYEGIFLLVLGGMGMMAIDDPKKIAPVALAGSFLSGVGGMSLHCAALRIQALWGKNIYSHGEK